MYSRVEPIIEKIQSIESFPNTVYYYHTLREPVWNLLKINSDIPYFLQPLCIPVQHLLADQHITTQELLIFLSEENQGQFYFSCNLYLSSKGISIIEAAEILDGKQKLLNDSIVDSVYLIGMLILHSIQDFKFTPDSLAKIYSKEEFKYETNDYKLSKVDSIDFFSKGFIYDKKFYLYNRFIPQEKLHVTDKMPAVFKILSEEAPIETADFYLRLDERLAVPENNIIEGNLNFDRFRGINFSFNKTNLQDKKTIIVHWNPETYDKLLMVIKKDFDNNLNEEVWHVEVEEIPNFDSKKVNSVTVSFIHGMYYPNQNIFRHIDFTVNKYPYEYYLQKYQDTTTSDINIDAYTTKDSHYKLWCIENENITEETWYKLVYLSLSEKYRYLFNEILNNREL